LELKNEKTLFGKTIEEIIVNYINEILKLVFLIPMQRLLDNAIIQ
jgi:hypothetical protein